MYKAMQVFFIHSYKSINPEGTAISMTSRYTGNYFLTYLLFFSNKGNASNIAKLFFTKYQLALPVF